MRVLVFTNMFPTAEFPFYGSFVKDETEALRRAGVELDVYFVNGRANKLAYAAMPFGFFARLRRTRYDVVHVHHSFCGLVATRQRRVPVVWTFHEGEITGGTADALREQPIKHVAYSKRMKQFVARRVDALVLVAEHLRAPLGRPDAMYLPAGIDFDLFAPTESSAAKRRLGLSGEKRYVLFPAVPSRVEKRYELAKRAVEIARERTPEMRDVELIALNNVPHEEVPYYMNASEAVLLTSAFEASPVVIREALACNVPVLSTDVGDARVMLEGIAGCAIVPPDSERIAEALRVALRSPRRVAGRAAMEKYSLANSARALVALYRDVVERRRR
ncbi:MAG: glycosyltransferase family 4 protein [Candidatus Latescibacteria bacterium]|nr:glycosyltransferase family 4 protein [Candidatus Latescibacterota bacterium]